MESFWLVIFLILFLFLSLGQVFKVVVDYDIYKNLGQISIKFFVFKVIKFSFSLSAKEIILKGKKTKVISFEDADPSLKFVEKMAGQIKDKLRIKEICLCVDIGFKEAQSTAIFCGGVDVFFKIFSSYIKNIKPTATVFCKANPHFKKQVLSVYFYGKMSLSIFDFVYALVLSVLSQNHT